MFYKYSYNPIMEDLENDCSLKLSSIVKIMANAGMYHSDLANDNLVRCSSKGKGWMLLDWKVKFLKYPQFEDKIICTTWLENFKSPFGTSRNFEMTVNGELYAKGSSKLVFIDLSTGKPTKVSLEIINNYKPEQKSVFEKNDFAKLFEESDYDFETELFVRRSDIDFNSHVHNLCYIDYALEALPESIYKNKQFKSLQVVYKSAIKDLGKIHCKYKKIENNHFVSIFDQNNNLCTLVEFF